MLFGPPPESPTSRISRPAVRDSNSSAPLKQSSRSGASSALAELGGPAMQRAIGFWAEVREEPLRIYEHSLRTQSRLFVCWSAPQRPPGSAPRNHPALERGGSHSHRTGASDDGTLCRSFRHGRVDRLGV